jgi:methyl-accepting chemotaxis protein
MMFKRMSLGVKIATGFSVVLLAALVIGLVAFFSTFIIVGSSQTLSQEFMPLVKLANNIERNYHEAMFSISQYTTTGEETFVQDGIASIQTIKNDLDSVDALIEESSSLQSMSSVVTDARIKVTEYETVISDMQDLFAQIDRNKKVLTRTSELFRKNCNDYLNNQKNQIVMLQFTGSETQTQDIADKINKINGINEIISAGNTIRFASLQLEIDKNLDNARAAMSNFETINKNIEQLKNMQETDTLMRKLDQTLVAMTAYESAMNNMLKNWSDLNALTKRSSELAEIVLNKTLEVANMGIDNTSKSAQGTTGIIDTASNAIVITLIAGLVVGIFIALMITRGVTRNIRKVILALRQGSEQVFGASNQVSNASTQMAAGASAQASSLEEVSSSLEQMASMTQHNAANAKQANALAQEASNSAANGNEAMKRMNEVISKIKASADETAKIVKTIDEIAFQTNLLALNAAVEAARAGESGKGFAVVAEEVRNLAQRSAEAAKTTSQLIEESQTNSASGVDASAEVTKILNEIFESANKVSGLVSEVATASEEQAEGIQQINNAVTQIDKITQENAANAEESSAASKDLSSQSRQLSRMVLTLQTIVAGAKAAGVKKETKKLGPGAERAKGIAGHEKRALKASEPERKGKAGPEKPPKQEKGKEKTMLSPEQVIPLDDEDLTDF